MQLVRQNKANLLVVPGTWYAVALSSAPNDVVAVFANAGDARVWATVKYPTTPWACIEVTVA